MRAEVDAMYEQGAPTPEALRKLEARLGVGGIVPTLFIAVQNHVPFGIVGVSPKTATHIESAIGKGGIVD